jgi:hypothetical protein
VLRRKLGTKFSNPDPEDIYVVMTQSSAGHCLCVTFKVEIVIRGEPKYPRENAVWGLQEVAEQAALC